MSMERLVQDNLEMTGQLRRQDHRLLGDASQVKILRSPPIVAGTGHMQEAHHGAAWGAAVQIVDRDV